MKEFRCTDNLGKTGLIRGNSQCECPIVLHGWGVSGGGRMPVWLEWNGQRDGGVAVEIVENKVRKKAGIRYIGPDGPLQGLNLED